MYGYIYKTTNKINNKIYIGKKSSGKFIETYYGSGLLINRAIKKYGLENFSIELIDKANSLEELNEKEKLYIEMYQSYYKFGQGYNIANGGDGGNLIFGWSDKRYKVHIEQCRIRNMGERNPNYKNGLKIAGEKNPSKRLDVRKVLSEKLRGKNNPMYGRRGENHPLYGKKHSEETKLKISDALKGEKHPMYNVPMNEETKRKISKAQKGRKMTEEQKQKMRGRVMSEEQKQYLSELKKNTRFKCKCKTCFIEYEGRSWNSTLCEQCKLIEKENVAFKMPKRKYMCICKTCSKEFEGNSSRSWYCAECKKSRRK